MSSLDQRIARLSPSERRLLELHLQRRQGARSLTSTITPRPSTGPAPLSYAQQRLWFLDQLQPGLTAYNGVTAYRLTGQLDFSALKRSLDEIIRRHESLRTTFEVHDGQPWQVIQPAGEFPLTTEDLAHTPADCRQSEIERRVENERNRPFDLTRDMMRRATLLRFGEQEHILILAGHHIASDAWSGGVMLRELSALYNAFAKGEPASLPDLPIQYADYAVWQRQYLSGEQLTRQLDYWRTQLADLQPLNLPTDHPRPVTYSYHGQRFHFTLSPHLATRLRALAQSESATLYMTLLAAFFAFLHRHTGQTNIAVGTPIANRNHLEIENLIGFFANTLVMACDLSGNPTFRELLRRVRRIALEAYEHQELPFERLVEELHPERSLNRNPLFQIVFQLLSGIERNPALLGLQIERLSIRSTSTHFDLELNLYETDNALSGALVYCTALFDNATAEALIGRWQILLERIVDDPDQAISTLLLLTEAEQHRLLVEWNDTRAPYPRDRCLHQLFEDQAERTPQATALLYADQVISYGNLNLQANRVACHLRRFGVGPGVKVGLFMHRSPILYISMLAILKAGGAYLPLDPALPASRLTFIQTDAQARLVLTLSDIATLLPPTSAQVLCVDALTSAVMDDTDGVNLPCVNTPDDLIYVMYTSGSSGAPKGVEIQHQAVSRLVFGAQYADVGPHQTFLQLAPLSFDASTFEIWCALVHGARLVIAPEGLHDHFELAKLISRHRVSVLWLTARFFDNIIEHHPQALAGVQCLLTGGAALSPRHVRKAQAELPGARLVNGYGPTENTTFTCCHVIPQDFPHAAASVPIGRPVENTQVYVLDAHMQLTPIGMIGELYSGGAGLARGYLRRPGLTAERFLPDPFTPGQRIYRTGDLARWRWDGALEFIGRVDDQVKVRGYRVEPGEIEATLALHPNVSACAVVARPDATGDMRLVAYFTSARPSAPTSSDLRNFLRASLPDYMTPAVYIQLESLPLTANGKVNRRALPLPDAERSTAAVSAPTTPVEEKLAALWAEVLGLPSVSIHESFFDLGGHSLLAVRLFARIEDEFGVRLPLALLFRSQTIAELAPHLAQPDAPQEWPTLVAIQTSGVRPPFFCVHGFGGGVVGYVDLARLLGPDQPFYGLQAAGLDGNEAPDLRVEDMATRYIAAMRSVQPHGPYRMGGYCFGGVVAFEMARQLEAQGEQAALVAIMEGYAPGARRRSARRLDAQRLLAIWRNLPYWLEDYWRLGAQEIVWRAQRKMHRWRWRLIHGAQKATPVDIRDVLADDAVFVPDHQRRLMEIHLAAIRAYRPQPYRGTVTFFAARGRTITSALTGSLDPQRGWGALALGGVTVHTVEGGHRNIHLPPNVASLAAALGDSLEKSYQPEFHASQSSMLAPSEKAGRKPASR
jgi:amino acid adenylation domain-containing protein